MQQRFPIRSGLIVVILAALCTPAQQKPPCPSPVDCGENALGVGEQHHYGLHTKFISRIENLAAVKELMAKLLMQHNEFADDNASGAEEESGSSESAPMSASNEVEVNSTEQPATSSALKEEDTATERPFDVDHLKLVEESGDHSSTTKKTSDEDSVAELTTVEPHHDNHQELTTIQPPKRINNDKLGDQTTAPTQAPQKKNTTTFAINLPPSKPSNRNKTKRTTTQRPHVIVHPQQLNIPNLMPFSENPEKISGRPTTKPKISTLMPVDRDHDVKDEIQLETLNRPISRRKPTATPVGSATSNRPKKKPINIIPQSSVVVKKGPKPAAPEILAGKPQGSPGTRNPTPPREPEDYIISALASIADGGDENIDGDDDDGDDADGDDGDEDDEYEEENSNENEGEEEDEDEYLSNSEEEIEERENFDSVDASDVISSVMKEVGALL